MSGQTTPHGGTAGRVRRLARALLVSEDASAALFAWLASPVVDAEFVGVLAGEDGRVGPAFRRQSGHFLPLPLPPVVSTRRPVRCEAVALATGRGDAFDDLLFSLGLRQALFLPLAEPPCSALIMARSGGPFSSVERDRLDEDLPLLGPALLRFERHRRRRDQATTASDEFAELFALTRELSRVAGPRRAARVAIDALQRQIRPDVGAIVMDFDAADDPIVLHWPEAAGEETASALAAGVARAREGGWLVPPAPGSRVRMVLRWQGRVPGSASRIAEAVLAALSLAVDRLEGERQREVGRLQEAVEALPLGVVLVNSRGRIGLVNRSARLLLESLGAWPGERGRLRKLGSVELSSMIAEACAGQPVSAEVYFPDRNRTLEMRVVPSRRLGGSDDDAAVDVLLILDDVSEALARKRQLIQAEKLSALGTLISGVVHELNNPLSTILGYAQMLVGIPDAPARSEWMKTILDEGQRCHRIVNNMLALARRHDDGFQLCSLKALAEKALSLVAYPYRANGIESSLRVDSDTPAVRGDQDALLQVLINLLTNAMHALEDFDGKRQVRVEIGQGGEGRARLVVADSGPGVPVTLQQKIFDPFFTTKEEGKGTGLGLSQVATTVAAHAGTIRLEQVPAGACFRIELPGVDADAVDETETASEGLPVATSLGGARVFVVDDEPAVAECLAEVLCHSGARVKVFHGALDALEAIRSDPPDVIISDLKMPRLSGEGLFLELEQCSPQLVEGLVFTTGDREAASHSEIVRRAARPCLAKPFDFGEVLRVVAETYSRKVVSLSPQRPLRPGSERGPELHG